jgi:predicted lipid carrier protein YhbT
VATVDQCREALQDLSGQMAANPDAPRIDLNRRLACQIRDLGVAFHAQLRDGAIVGLADGDDLGAQIRFTVLSDDLVALVAGQLPFATAWAQGRLSVRGGFGDLLKLRKLL